MTMKPIRVLLAKLGLDWHNWGLRVLAIKLRQAGMEVIYQENVTTDEIIEIAIQEDVDVIGLSSLTGAYRLLVPEFMKALKDKGMGDTLVIVGGIIQKEDMSSLKQQGVAEVFGARTPTQNVIDFIKNIVPVKKR